MKMNVEYLNEVVSDLPIIRPIKEFIHLNLLLPYQHLPFWEALSEVSAKLEAYPFLGLDHYRTKIKNGELPLELLRNKLKKISEVNVEEALKFILESHFEYIHHESRSGRLHQYWNETLGINIIELADGMLIKWLAMFLDQGIGHWQMPKAEELTFYQTIRNLMISSLIKPDPFRRDQLEILFPETPIEAIDRHLNFLCPEIKYQKEYISEAIITLRGWAGMIYTIQQSPQLLPFKRKIDLADFLAVKLILERAWIEREGYTKVPAFSISQEDGKQDNQLTDKEFLALRACQETLEEVAYDKYMRAIITGQKEVRSPAKFQAVFCMDDREGSLREFLEQASPSIETFGTAGHFGIECMYQHPEDAFPKKQCPAPTPPKVLLKDIPLKGKKPDKNNGLLTFEQFRPTGNFFHDWMLSLVSGIITTFKLSINLFFPLALKPLANIREVELDTKLKLYNKDTRINHGELPEGYTLESMAQLVHQQLLLIGFVHHFAPLIFIIGHGSTSVNNPYFATYGCGACSGRSGAANARAIVEMANNLEVRELLKNKYGLKIPEETRFVAAFHDTTSNIVDFFETTSLSQAHRPEFNKFKKYLELALYKNAKEKSKLFKLVTYNAKSKNAQKELIKRSNSLFETRPEMGHTNVAFAFVGRRQTTEGMIPEKPSFFQSYDATIDPKGELLATVLAAVVPVCSGINLDYFFSRVDNTRFGAGSKLPQNIVGNLGVSHGTESDLLFGLPFQMIDQHQPLRLLILVEQGPDIALSAIQDNPLVRQIIYNQWVNYACYEKESQKFYLFTQGQMIHKTNFWEGT